VNLGLELFFSYRREPQPVGRDWACSGRGVKVGVHNIAPQIFLASSPPWTWLQSGKLNPYLQTITYISDFQITKLLLTFFTYSIDTKLVIPYLSMTCPKSLNKLLLISLQLHYKPKVTSVQTINLFHYKLCNKLSSGFITDLLTYNIHYKLLLTSSLQTISDFSTNY
jgi:hypothetical protein